MDIHLLTKRIYRLSLKQYLITLDTQPLDKLSNVRQAVEKT